MSIFFVGLFALLAGLGMDLNKSVYMNKYFHDISQETANQSVRMVNRAGSLDESAVFAAVNNYNSQYSGDDHWGTADSLGGTMEGSALARTGACTTVDPTLPGGAKLTDQPAPFLIITLEGGRSGDAVTPVSYISAGGAAPTHYSGVYNPAYKYHSINIVSYETAPSIMLSMFGVPCQNFRKDVTSIAFSSQEDVVNFGSP